MSQGEPEVREHEPMPKGYRFVPKGNVYITKNCRKKTHEAGKTLYVVVDKRGKPMGLRCPAYIHNLVMSENKATASRRAKLVQNRDAAIRESFEKALLDLFPKIPKEDLSQILDHSLKKHSRRVGRTGKVALQDRVKLAVRAHIRHAHTEYDQLLRQGVSRQAARERIWGKLNEVARRWGGRPLKPVGTTPVGDRRTKRGKKAAHHREKLGPKFVAKAAAVRRGRVSTRSTGREAPGPYPTVPLSGPRTRPKTTRLRSPSLARERPAPEDSDTCTIGGFDANVDGYFEDVDAQDAVFTVDEETSDDESDDSGWNWSDVDL
ncbi:uncharacterized protein P884DRAFT_282179 [Thermothelomyces heterothallicus CBS 202.75]|uniref:uncharacterized protein n=1 Tax=Thermothelomyces heterothallicus CBS 202.75 TaxID=1149848 RepID=UPI0037435059